MTNPSTFSEDAYEQTILSLFKDELGYTQECGYDIERDFKVPYYEAVLQESLNRINKGSHPGTVAKAIEQITSIKDGTLVQRNERFMGYLQDGIGVPYTVKGESATESIQLIDYAHPENNDFRVVNQWRVVEFATKRCDIVVFVNGLPLVVVELKSPSADETDVHDAFLQIKNYQDKLPSLFVFNCFSVISDMAETLAGTITASEDRYMAWKTKDGDYETTDFADYTTLFEGMFQKKRLLDIIRNFICFDKRDGKATKILSAYHQYFAVTKALLRTQRAVDSDGKIGVFWHTQGSGKSLSMVFFAHQLVTRFAECTIVVVTDRQDLDEQLFGQFTRCTDYLRQKPMQAESRAQLIDLLKSRKAGGIIFTTIQKFTEGDTPLSDRHNVIVMTDEAHRSQYGDEHWDVKSETMKKGFAQKMREALPNASFIGFTGTPISDRDRDTEEVFGDYIDIYDMSQAVADGATRPVYYESRVMNLDLDDDVLRQLDAEFEALAEEGATDEQLNDTKHELSRLEQILGAESTLDSLVNDIIFHYENYRAKELTGKAMIVAYSREIAIKILMKILEKRPAWKEKVKVVLSDSNKDKEEWSQFIGNTQYKKQLAVEFKKNDSEFKIAIVRDMWLTGFDVPSLATMYVYKAMSGHNLMQAIARVNRVFPEKEGGLIIDYIGIAQALRQAMKDYTGRDRQRYGDPNIAKTAMLKWQEEMEICRDQMHGFDYELFFTGSNKQKSDTIQDGVNHLLQPKWEQKKRDFVEHSKLLHNYTTLCKSLLTDRDRMEVGYFDSVRVLIMRLSGKGPITKREINERIGALLEQSIESHGVTNLFEGKSEFSLFDEGFIEQIKKMKQKNLALELLKKLLRHKVSEFKKTNLVQSERFSELLEKAVNSYINGLITNEQVIEELLALANQIKEEEERSNALGLTQEEKAFYDALTRPQAVKDFYTNEQLVELTRALTEELRKSRTIDWNKKESARAQMRITIKRLLKFYKYPPEEAKEALEIVMEQCNNWADQEENFEDLIEPAYEAPVVKMYDFEEPAVRMVADEGSQRGDYFADK